MSREWGRSAITRCLFGAAIAIVTLGCGNGGKTPLVIYSPHGRDLLRLTERLFEAENPDIDVRALDMGSQEALDRVRSERVNPQSDVWFGGPSILFARAASDSLLTAYRPSWASAIPERDHGVDDFFFSVYQTPAVIAYNSDVIEAIDAPQDWDDVLAPKWSGQVLIRNPIASGTMRAIFGMVILRGLKTEGDTAAGFNWLRRLDALTIDYPLNPALLHQKLLRQEGALTLWDLPDILIEQSRGSPFGYVLPTSGTPVIRDAIAVVRGARHLAAAQRFVEWVGSTSAQLRAAQEMFRIPVRQDLPPDSLPQWLRDVRANLVVEEMDWDRIATDGAGWMTYWDRNVRGRGTTDSR